MSSSVDQIKSKIDIVSLISSYIKLEKSGGNFKGRCPFHNEKTPSFFVSPDRGGYYCFGCHAKGDIFTFIQEFEGLDFLGSLKVLADKAGVTLDRYDRGEKTEKDRPHQVLEQAVIFYQQKLSDNKEALAYLHGRGITDETITSFRIGFAPVDWRQLSEHLTAKGISEQDMFDVGLIKRKDGARPYDTFRGRVMFPINDSAGRVVAFSGRILIPDEKSPKYLNSPETQLYNKSDILFGLDKAKNDIRLKDYSILVEGQMDLVMMHQADITNTVASSGTALTAEHLVKLRRLSNNLKMFFDGDNAGFAASNRSAKIALSLGMELKLVQIPDGKDPADLVKENLDVLRQCLKNAKNIVDFYVDTLLARKLDSKELSVEVRKNVLPYVAELPHKTDRDNAIQSIVRKTYINEEALKDDLSQIRSGIQVESPKHDMAPPILGKRTEVMERRIVGVVMWQKGKDGPPDINLEETEQKVARIFGDRIHSLYEQFEKEKDILLFETESYYAGKENLAVDIDELLSGLEEEYLKKEFTLAMASLQKAEQLRDSSEILRYLEICQRISRQINEIKNAKK
jgi:DNA primase